MKTVLKSHIDTMQAALLEGKGLKGEERIAFGHRAEELYDEFRRLVEREIVRSYVLSHNTPEIRVLDNNLVVEDINLGMVEADDEQHMDLIAGVKLQIWSKEEKSLQELNDWFEQRDHEAGSEYNLLSVSESENDDAPDPIKSDDGFIYTVWFDIARDALNDKHEPLPERFADEDATTEQPAFPAVEVSVPGSQQSSIGTIEPTKEKSKTAAESDSNKSKSQAKDPLDHDGDGKKGGSVAKKSENTDKKKK